MMGKIFGGLIALIMLAAPATADVRGKVDAGPTAVSVRTIQDGNTVQRFDLYGVSANATVVPWGCLALKPSLVWATGSHGDLWNIGLAAGALLPLNDCWYFTPNAGISFGNLETVTDYLVSLAPLTVIPNLVQEFKTRTPFLGLDVTYVINELWMVSGGYQYGWSRSHTTIGNSVNSKTESTGSNYFLQVDYFFTCELSAHIAYARNKSLSKEKHGLEISGWRLGLGYTF